jgi:hypothetical protein
VIIPGRFGGPPGAANGGYVAGTLAGDRAAEVTIRRPVPVDVELRLQDGRLLDAEGTLLAEVVPLGADDAAALAPLGETLPRVTIAEARAAAQRSPLATGHPFPTCFGCGPDHPDGLHCLAGPVGRDDLCAVAFTPPDGTPPILWAALDCPSAAGHMADAPGVPHVLGRIAAVQLAPLVAGEPHAVVSRTAGADGRRRYSVSAVLDAGGATVAVARATWFALGSTV